MEAVAFWGLNDQFPKAVCRSLVKRTSWLEEFFIAQAQVYVNHKPQKL